VPTIFQTQINAAALEADGAYVFEQIASQLLPAGPNSGLVIMPGLFNWGPIGQVRYFGSYASGVPIHGDTQVALSSANGKVDYGGMARVYLAAAAGASSFAVTRVTDGSDAAASIIIGSNPASPTTSEFAVLTGVWHGSFGNRISYQIDITSGTSTNNPVCRLTIFPPVGNPEVFPNILGYAPPVATFSQSALSANIIAAVNGLAGSPASKWVVASAPGSLGSGVFPAGVGTPIALTGGLDGNANSPGLTDALIVGTDGPAGVRTGLYMFRTIAGAAKVILPGVSASSSFGALATFCSGETCMGVWGNLVAGQSTAEAVQYRATNFPSGSQFLMGGMSWIQFADPATGVLRYLEPSAVLAGVWASCPPIGPGAYPGNKPPGGLINGGALATEDTASGIPLSLAEAGERESNGWNWIASPAPGGQAFALFHGMMSDAATYASDVSAAAVISINIANILAKFVGQMQGTSANDATRAAARAKVNEYMGTLPGLIESYDDVLDITNNTPTTIAEGQMLCSLTVKTLTPVRFAVAAVQVGAGVTITVSPAT
jgi:hypothetical protein